MRNKLYRLTLASVEQTLKMKFFVILNILVLLTTIGYVNFGSVKQIISNAMGKEEDNVLEIMVVDETNSFIFLTNQNNVQNLKFIDYEETKIKEGIALLEIKYDADNVINVKITSNEYIDNNYYSVVQSIINKIRTNIFSKKYNIDELSVNKLNENVPIERHVLKADYTDYIKYEGVILVIAFVIYMLFIFVASTIASSIGLEKISKTTEYMLTGISESAYLWYNILQTNIIFVIQMILAAIYYVIAVVINNIISMQVLDLSMNSLDLLSKINFDPIILKIIILTFIQSFLCLLILSIIQAIFASRVNNLTDISNSSMLVIFLVILVCFVSPNLINISSSTHIFVKLISILPVFSIVMVPKLILLHQIGNAGIIVAIVLNVLTLIILSSFGAKWFKKGLLDSDTSKKIDKRYKDEINDLNKTKFKEVIFKISIAMLIFFVLSNTLGIIGSVINSVFDFSSIVQSMVNMIVWILSIIFPYLYLKSSIEKDTKIDESKDKINIQTDKLKDKSKLKQMVNWILMGLFLVTVIQYVVSKFAGDDAGLNIIELLNFDFTSTLGVILFTLQLSILPAIFEELLFRGVILNMLKKYGNGIAIVISAICFGLMHQNITQGVFAFLMGVILAYITLKTKTIIPAMTIHFLNNFTAVILTIAMKTDNDILLYMLVATIIAIGSISSIYMLHNLLRNKNIFILEKATIQINNISTCIFSQYIVVITLFLYILVTVYIQTVLF